MPLLDLELETVRAGLPGDVRGFLRQADRRIRRFSARQRLPAFVPSDFERAYEVRATLAAADHRPGTLFCEWGSGFGVVACLAAQLDFDACGIEIEADLVAAARQLAADFDLPVEFVRGSFIPPGGAVCLGTSARFNWLATDEADATGELGLRPEDFGVIFAYPWPDEEGVTEALFDRFARSGAVLVTYHGGEDFRLRRKQ